MDNQALNRVRKKVKVLGGLKKDLDKMATGLINDVQDPGMRDQLNKVRREAMQGNRSPAEQMLKNLNKK